MSDILDEYDEELIQKIGNTNNWPVVSHQNEINKLFKVAFDAYDQKTEYGYIACVLIWHQIIEHLMIHLIELSYLYLQAEIWPTKIDLDIKKEKAQMYGQYDKLLAGTIEFKGKDEFLEHTREFNKLRIQFVHKLATIKNKKSVEKTAYNAKFIFTQKVIRYYQVSEKSLVSKLLDLEQRVDWNDL